MLPSVDVAIAYCLLLKIARSKTPRWSESEIRTRQDRGRELPPCFPPRWPDHRLAWRASVGRPAWRPLRRLGVDGLDVAPPLPRLRSRRPRSAKAPPPI